MLIDFHAHAFPEKIAGRTIETLVASAKKVSNYILTPSTDGTVADLKRLMKESSVDLSIVLPIATKVTQSETINNYAKEITEDNIISFGSLHPMQGDCEEVIKRLADSGFKGIKLHPEFQDFYIDSTESIKVLTAAEKNGLMTVIHAGADVGFKPPIHATPERISHTLEYISGNKLVCGHLGSWNMWDDVEKYLVGSNVWFDTAYLARTAERGQVLRIIRNHGADKILFGSDVPWESPADTLKFIESLGLDDEELEKIKHLNAEQILFGD